MASVVRMCQGLDLSLADLFREWLGRILPIPGPEAHLQHCQEGILTCQDVQHWLSRILEGHRRSREILIAALNLIVLRSGLLATPFPPLSQLFSLADIEKMLWDLPWFRFEVTPPLQCKPLVASLPSIRLSGGLILPSEIGAYLELLRCQHDLSLKQLNNQSRVNLGTLTYLECGKPESGKYGRLILYDVLRLDDCLQQNGTLVELYWSEISSRMCLEQAWNDLPEMAVCSTRAKHRLVSLLVSVGRWFQYIYQDDTIWLSTIRNVVEAGTR